MTRAGILIAETAGAAAIVAGVTAAAAPQDVWLAGGGLHPMWIIVIVMAARYATAGLFAGLAVGGLALVVAGLLTGTPISDAAIHVRASSDLLALATAVLVTWIAMLHETRLERAEQRLTEAAEQQRDADDKIQALHASLAYLRTRHDRLDIALGLWRSLAARMERGDAHEAARAALELCEIRSGARAGGVLMRQGARGVTLAWRGTWSPGDLGAHDLGQDTTVRAAILGKHVTPAQPGAAELDADVAVPIIDDDTHEVIGVIALRGVSPARMHAAELRDLGVIAQWLAPAIARHAPAQRPITLTGGRS